MLVFVAVLSIAEGFERDDEGVGDPELVLVLRAGSDTEMTSGLAGDAARIIQDAPGIARDGSGAPMTSPELFVVVDHPLKRSGSPANVPLRGVTPEAFKVHSRPEDRRGAQPRSSARTRSSSGRAAAGQFARPHRRQDVEVGREHVDAGRHLR